MSVIQNVETLTGSAASTYVKSINGRAVRDDNSIHDLSASGNTITYTKGDGSTDTVTVATPSHNQASNTINVMTGYSKPSSTSAIAATDSLNAAIGKLEKADDNSIHGLSVSGKTITYTKGNGATDTITTQDTDTKNTAGSTNSTSKLFLVGATSQSANPQTYSNVNCYVTNGTVYGSAASFTGNVSAAKLIIGDLEIY